MKELGHIWSGLIAGVGLILLACFLPILGLLAGCVLGIFLSVCIVWRLAWLFHFFWLKRSAPPVTTPTSPWGPRA